MQTGKIGVTSENLFPIIKKFLYSDHDIFLREIVSNAVDATQKLRTLASKGEYSGDITNAKVEVKLDKKAKTVTVSDNGIGIPHDQIKKIFQKFHRIYDNDIPNVKGTGLGLYVVKEIIKNHKGKIVAVSEGKGKGSSFKIEFPIYNHKKKSAKESKGI